MSSPSGFKKSRICSAHAALKFGSMAQKNLLLKDVLNHGILLVTTNIPNLKPTYV